MSPREAIDTTGARMVLDELRFLFTPERSLLRKPFAVFSDRLGFQSKNSRPCCSEPGKTLQHCHYHQVSGLLRRSGFEDGVISTWRPPLVEKEGNWICRRFDERRTGPAKPLDRPRNAADCQQMEAGGLLGTDLGWDLSQTASHACSTVASRECARRHSHDILGSTTPTQLSFPDTDG